jgi:hypothetical protein
MFAVNGRVGNDKNIGRFTCRNASIVDYCMTSPGLLKLFFDFDILESSKLFSDVHAPLVFLVNFTINVFTIKRSKRFHGRTCEDIAKIL